jgi:MFS family permease
MVYEERNTWTGLVVSLVGVAVYVIVIAQQAASRPITDVDWVPVMLWTIGGAIVASIVLSILWGIVAGGRDREGVGKSDQRDRDIAQMGGRVGQAFLVLAGLGAIVLCAFEADWFWIANVVFFGFALSAIVGGIASVIAYRRGLV